MAFLAGFATDFAAGGAGAAVKAGGAATSVTATGLMLRVAKAGARREAGSSVGPKRVGAVRSTSAWAMSTAITSSTSVRARGAA